MSTRTKPDMRNTGAEHARTPLWLVVLRCLVLCGAVAVVGSRWAAWKPDTLFVLVAVVCVVFGQFRAFIRHFLPFLGLLVVYSWFRSIADDLNEHVHYGEMIAFDRWLVGGTLPTHWLQERLWHGRLQWYDFYFYALYTLHFVVPIVLALFLWKRRARLYWPFVASFVGLSFAAFLTFLAFPAAPPWMASEDGYVPPLRWISMDIWTAMGITHSTSVYNELSPNLVAAVPSLHAAYPTLVLIFLAKSFGWRRVWWAGLYPASVWFGTVYLGEHYVFDVIAGVLYTVVTSIVVSRIFARRRAKAGPSPGAARQPDGEPDMPVLLAAGDRA